MAPGPKPKLRRIAVAQLHLDPQNPRLILEDGADEGALIAKLYEDESLDELYPSFVENGYFEEEPLVVVPEAGTAGDDKDSKAGPDKLEMFTVVEGNRRLATLKLLLNPRLRRPANVAGWPTLTEPQRAALDPVPCVVYETRNEVLPFLGFRHITGARKWRPFQKARFVSQLLDSGQSLDHVQEVIGDDASATKKLYQDFVVYTQLVEELNFPAERIRERFSLLEVMLGQRAIKTHLSMSQRLPTHKVESVVPENNLDDLNEVAGWVFGTDEHDAVIADSREIGRMLAPVIKDPDALGHLRRTNDLEAAYDRSGGEQEFLLKKITRAEKLIQDIAGVLPIHASERAVVDGVTRLETLVRGLARQLTD